MRIFIYDAGTFGTAVGVALARAGHEVTMLIQTYDYPHLKMLLCFERTGKNEYGKRENNLHLPAVELPENIIFTDKPEKMSNTDIIFLAVPCKYLGEAFLKTIPYLEQNPKAILTLLSKGFDSGGMQPWGMVLGRHVGFKNFAVISGPAFAPEIVRPYQIHHVSAASRNLNVIKNLYHAFKETSLQLHGTIDLIGVSWGGGLKNAYAIGYGILEKLAGESAAWKYIWMALDEMKVFLNHAGAHPKTLRSPAVQGDFYITCRGDSRNKKFGAFLAEYHAKKEIEEYAIKHTVEGDEALKTLWHIAQICGLSAPLLYGIHAIREFGASPDTFLRLVS